MKKLFAKFIYWIYLKTLTKKKWIEGCIVVFNHGGHNYYKYKDSGKIPMPRLEEIQLRVIMLENKMNKSELNILLDIVDVSIDNAIDSFNKEGRMKALKNVMYANKEMRSRQDDLMFHPGILMELAALSLIRDDENPFIVNDLLTNEKVDLFTKQSHHIDFFLQSGLSEFLPNSNELITESEKQLKAYKEQYDLTQEMINKKYKTYEKILGKTSATNIQKN